MEDDEEVQSQQSPGTGSPSSPSPNGRITVTVATAPPAPNDNMTLALPAQQMQAKSGVGGGREDCWSEGATAVLIDAWGERYLELSRGNLKQKHWKEVADIVSSREDYTKPPKTEIQCKNRIDTVKKKYKLEKGKISTGGGPSKWPFFHRLDQLIGTSSKTASAVAIPAAATGSQKVPMGIPVGVRTSNQFPPLQQKIPTQPQPRPQPQQDKQKQQFRRKPPAYSDSSESEPEPSPPSADSFPPVTFERKRPRIQRELKLSSAQPKPNRGSDDREKPLKGGGEGGGGNGREGKEKNWENSLKELTRAILKFGEAYEQAETSKLQQVVEMEKQRMKFTKELELQRMQFFMKTQLELSQLGNRKVGASNHRMNNNTSVNNNNNNSDSSN